MVEKVVEGTASTQIYITYPAIIQLARALSNYQWRKAHKTATKNLDEQPANEDYHPS